RRVEELLHVPAGAKKIPLRYINTTIKLFEKGEALHLTVEITKCGELLVSKSHRFEKQIARNTTSNEAEIRDAFQIFGTAGIISRTCEVEAVEGFFLPRSVLKEFKRELAAEILEKHTSRLNSKK